jgi:hypothetical protein
MAIKIKWAGDRKIENRFKKKTLFPNIFPNILKKNIIY